MNVYQSIPRRDCRVFAKCGAKSLSHCRRHRGTDGECKNCTLIHRKPRNRFYNRIVVRKGKEYHLLTSWCRMCMSEINNQRNLKKRNE